MFLPKDWKLIDVSLLVSITKKFCSVADKWCNWTELVSSAEARQGTSSQYQYCYLDIVI